MNTYSDSTAQNQQLQATSQPATSEPMVRILCRCDVMVEREREREKLIRNVLD
jgi:hypothetical protein